MVCPHCIMVVRDQLVKMGFRPSQVNLGEVIFPEPLSAVQREKIARMLLPFGFKLMDDKRKQLIEKIKNTVIELVHRNNSLLKVNLSDYLTEKLPYSYTYLSNLFSEIENITIEKYFIAQKIERAKELLVYNELTLNQIADLLNYSGVAHLSAQFKKVTGLTPSHFKKIKENRRKPLDQL
ncbi:MAG: AraC family transcriptional regulator [Candidatus Azobacteroides sp.]|nr:AraC family transcriptional regulator [Candidatus Azobacteroides sp.]